MILPPFIQAGNTDWQIFTPKGDVNNARYQTWLKPPGAQWIYIFGIGGGGGGGGGQSGAGTARTGGGGGGTAGSHRILMPAFSMPDILYICPGSGGAGGAAGSNGSSGSPSRVAWTPTQNNEILTTGNGGGGQAAGTGGSIGGASGVQFAGFLGLPIFTNGFSGGAGGANTGAAGSQAPSASSALGTPGAGGGSSPAGNTTFAGGLVVIQSPPTGPAMIKDNVLGGSPGVSGTTPGGNGLPGIGLGGQLDRLFSRGNLLFFTGGSGGGSGGASNGGRGGDGAWASGGGGGGAGAVGGAGGRGGDGFVIIGAF